MSATTFDNLSQGATFKVQAALVMDEPLASHTKYRHGEGQPHATPIAAYQELFEDTAPLLISARVETENGNRIYVLEFRDGSQVVARLTKPKGVPHMAIWSAHPEAADNSWEPPTTDRNEDYVIICLNGPPGRAVITGFHRLTEP